MVNWCQLDFFRVADNTIQGRSSPFRSHNKFDHMSHGQKTDSVLWLFHRDPKKNRLWKNPYVITGYDFIPQLKNTILVGGFNPFEKY